MIKFVKESEISANALFELINSNDEVIIVDVEKITGESSDILSLATSSKILGFGTQDFFIDDIIDDSVIKTLETLTTGTIQLSQ
tara:strand:- start:2430 stop:2681 length:252 start_codon:yes stop_codon:yes gene_type:complete